VPDARLKDFLAQSRFRETGALMTDLDGTALREMNRRVTIAPEVASGLKALRAHGRPIILNTLRFPANVIRSMGPQWHAIQGGAVPLVSLNGGIGGMIERTASGAMGFEEIFAKPLTREEIETVLSELEAEMEAGAPDPLLFFHPRDWRLGETLWTPEEGRIPDLKRRYPHADRVISLEMGALRDELLSCDICLVLMPHGDLPIYRQQQRRDFFTGGTADKLSGARRMTEALGVELAQSIGAGDTEMDVFLTGTGLAIRVGAQQLEYEGVVGTIDVADPEGFGATMLMLAGLLGEG